MTRALSGNINHTLITANPSNIFYLTGYAADFAYLVSSGSNYYYLSDSRFTIEAVTKLDPEVTFIETTRQSLTDDVLKLIPSGETEILLDMDVPYYDCCRMKDALKGYKISDASPLLTEMRVKKNEIEIECIVKAQRIAEKALDELKPYIAEGVTERELQLRLEYNMGVLGSEGTAFDTITAFGENSACAHAKPSGRRLKARDIVLFDFGATYRGYRSDMTRTFVYGEITPHIANMYDAVLDANISALEAVKVGALCKDVDKSAREKLKTYGLDGYFTHSTGHGVGIDIHEAPAVAALSEIRLERGMVITVEPGVYIPNIGGVRIEDMAAVGCGSLTEYPKKLEVLR